jgi:hypothetical protein
MGYYTEYTLSSDIPHLQLDTYVEEVLSEPFEKYGK